MVGKRCGAPHPPVLSFLFQHSFPSVSALFLTPPSGRSFFFFFFCASRLYNASSIGRGSLSRFACYRKH